MISVVRGGDDDVDPDPLFRRGDGGSCPPSWGHQFPELCRGDREGSRWAWKKSVFVFLWPFVVGWRLVHERSGRFRGPTFYKWRKGGKFTFGAFWIRKDADEYVPKMIRPFVQLIHKGGPFLHKGVGELISRIVWINLISFVGCPSDK